MRLSIANSLYFCVCGKSLCDKYKKAPCFFHIWTKNFVFTVAIARRLVYNE